MRVLQIVLEDMALISRVGRVVGTGHDGVTRFTTGVGGNGEVLWLTAFSRGETGNDFINGRLYDVDPRTFVIRRSVATPIVQSARNRPLAVCGDNHTVWVYNAAWTFVTPGYFIYKMSAVTFAVQRRFDLKQTWCITGDRHGFWAIRADTTYPSGQQIRLVYYTAGFVKQVDRKAPLYQFGPSGANRKVLSIAGAGGKDPANGRDRLLLFKTQRDDEGTKIFLLDTSTYLVLRRTSRFRGVYGTPAIGR